MFLLLPLTCVYYPVSILPGWLQAIAWILPPTYVFEGMRALADRPCLPRRPDAEGAGAQPCLFRRRRSSVFMQAAGSRPPAWLPHPDRRIALFSCINGTGKGYLLILILQRRTGQCCAATRPGIEKCRLGNSVAYRACRARARQHFRRACTGLYEMGHAALNPARALADVTRLYFKNPLNPLVAYHVRQIDRCRRRDVRALDAPLRQAGLADRSHDDRRRARSGPHPGDLGAAVLQPPAFRARVRSRTAPSAAEAPDRRADVGALRNAAARHGRSLPAQS